MPDAVAEVVKESFEDRLRREIFEAAQASASTPALSIVDSYCNEPQKTFLRAGRPFQAWIATRRSSKSTGAAVGAIDVCLRKPGSQCLYIGLTLEAVLRVVYYEILPHLFAKYQIPAELKHRNQIVFENGSRIHCLGTDADRRQRDKFRGFKGALVVVDECQSHTQDLRILLHEVIGPTLADSKSPLWLLGTAGNKQGTNYWYEVTGKKLHPQWWVFESSWEQNDSIDAQTGEKVCDNVASYLAELRAKHPGIEKTTAYRQEWCREWVTNASARIYRYQEGQVDPPSEEFIKGAAYILGLDLGYEDPTAFVVGAYNPKVSNKLYVVESMQRSHMLVPDIVTMIRKLDEKYRFVHMVGDSSSLQVFETLRQSYSLPLEKAARAGKLGHQMIINSDFEMGSVVVMPGLRNQELISQLQTVIWDEVELLEGKFIEDQAFQNHLTDSLLYLHHFSRHQWYEPPKKKRGPLTQEEYQAQLAKTLMARTKAEHNNIDFALPNDGEAA